MEIPVESIISIVGLLFGGGGIGVFFTWRYQRKKAKAEARQKNARIRELIAKKKDAALENMGVEDLEKLLVEGVDE